MISGHSANLESMKANTDNLEINQLIAWFNKNDYSSADEYTYIKNKARLNELAKETFWMLGAKKEIIQELDFFHVATMDSFLVEEEKESSSCGNQISQNFHLAYQRLKQSQMNGFQVTDPATQYLIGVIYWYGLFDITKNHIEAVEWFQKAATQEFALAQFEFGRALALGIGVQKNEAQAAKYYRKAAAKGLACGQNNFGLMCENGRGGVQQNDAEAAEWYRKAAAQGSAAGQYNFGWMCQDGRGVQQNDAVAAEWYRKAAEQKPVSARKKLEKMNRKGNADYHLAVVDGNVKGLVSLLYKDSKIFWENLFNYDVPKILHNEKLQTLFYEVLNNQQDEIYNHKLDPLIFLLHATPQWNKIENFFSMDIAWLLEVDAIQLSAESRELYVLELHAHWLELKHFNDSDPRLNTIIETIGKLFQQNLLSDDAQTLLFKMLVFPLCYGKYTPTCKLKPSPTETEFLYSLYLMGREDSELYTEEIVSSVALRLLDKNLIIENNLVEDKEEFPEDNRDTKILYLENLAKGREKQKHLEYTAQQNRLDTRIEALAQAAENNSELRELVQYLRQRARTDAAEYTNPFGFFSGWFGGYSKQQKVDAAIALIDHVTIGASLLPQQRGALSQGRLGQLTKGIMRGNSL